MNPRGLCHCRSCSKPTTLPDLYFVCTPGGSNKPVVVKAKSASEALAKLDKHCAFVGVSVHISVPVELVA